MPQCRPSPVRRGMADYTYADEIRYTGVQRWRGSSARETVGRVAAGAIAEKFLLEQYGIEFVAWVNAVGTIAASGIDEDRITRNAVDQTMVRCPSEKDAAQMVTAIQGAKEAKDSLGGIITCICRNVPAGLGEPVFEKMEASLAQAMLSIPATKGFEIGSGFSGTRLTGSIHNDPFIKRKDRLGTLTNHSGGVQGGISNGEPIIFRVAFKPPATIGQAQSTVDFNGYQTTLEAKGRHDPCVVPRAVPIVESMAALVIADMALRQKRMTNVD